MLSKETLLDVFVILLISLLPFWWLRGGSVILGHDSGTTLSPTSHFQDRLSTWTNRYSGGADQSFALAGFYIHGLEAALEQLPLSLSSQQAVQFSLYFFLIGLSMYVFSKIILGSDQKIIPLVAAVVYQINHFILQAWFIVERTKFSLYIALPLVLALLFLTLKRHKNPFAMGTLAALVVGVLNGGGFLPLYGAIFLSSLVFSLALTFLSPSRIATAIQLLKFILVAVFISALIHAHWLVPYAVYVRTNFAVAVEQSGGIDGVINWVKSISENTSFINLLRLQGIQEWYVNDEHPYAKYYFQVSLKLVSFLIPLVFVLSLKFMDRKNKGTVLTLLLVAMISIFFMAGSHPPFGWFYVQLIRFVPGFIAFRTPFYKFAPGLYVAFAPLFALVIARLVQLKVFSKVSDRAKKVSIVSIILLYNFPFFSSNFFQYTSELTTKVEVPGYVNDYKQFAHSKDFVYQKTLLVPGRNFETGAVHFNWGYWSLASLHSILDNNRYVVPPSEGKTVRDKLLADLYQSILNGQQNWLPIARHLRIDSILLERDFKDFDYNGEVVTGESFSKVLSSTPELKKVKTFGEWELYELEGVTNVTNQHLTLKAGEDATNLSGFLFQNLKVDPSLAFTQETISLPSLKQKGIVIFPECLACYQKEKLDFFFSRSVFFQPDSLLYKLFSPLKQWQSLPQGLEYDPVYTYQDLKTIESQFNNKVAYPQRSLSWERYLQSLTTYEIHLNQFIKDYQPNLDNSKKLQALYANFQLQNKLLQVLAGSVNQKEEATQFFRTKNLLSKISDLITTKLDVELSSHQRVFAFEVDQAAEYDLHLYLPSSNHSLSNTNSIFFKIDEKQYQVPKLSSAEWMPLTTIYIDEGFHTFTLEDVPFRVELDFSRAEYVTSNHCSKLEIGALDSNDYLLQMSGEADLIKGEISVHIRTDDDAAPLLPFWGVRQQVDNSRPISLDVPFQAKKGQNYTLFVCDSGESESSPIVLEQLTLDRLPQPSIVLSHLLVEPDLNTATVTVRQETNTRFTIEPESKTQGLISLDLPFNSIGSWLADDTKQVQPVKIDGVMTGLVVDGGVGSAQKIELNYKPQRFLKVGWVLTALGFIVSGVILFRAKKR